MSHESDHLTFEGLKIEGQNEKKKKESRMSLKGSNAKEPFVVLDTKCIDLIPRMFLDASS